MPHAIHLPRLSRQDIDKALQTNPEMFPGHTRCAICFESWWAHNGSLCPVCGECGKLVYEHQAKPQGTDLVQVRGKADVYWVFCQGGETTFLPDLGELQFDA